MNLKKTALTAALAAAMGTGSMMAGATTALMTMNWNGYFTMVNPTGSVLVNTDLAGGVETVFNGYRTPITGSMTFCAYLGDGGQTSCGALAGGQGTGSVVPFSFFGSGNAIATTITFGVIGAGPLVLGNMGFNWAGNNGIPVSIVLDGSGFFGAFQQGMQNQTFGTSTTVSGVGVLGGSDNTNMGGTNAKPVLMPLGVLPMATTTWNTTDIGAITLGTNPSGTLPLIADTLVDGLSCNLVGTSCGVTKDTGIGGTPMKAGPFPNYNANFDVASMHITSMVVSNVPVPAAAWLFGSGLMGLVGVARRKRSA